MGQEPPSDCRILVIEILWGFGDGRLGEVIICDTTAVRMPFGLVASVMNEYRGFFFFFLVVSMCGLLRGFFPMVVYIGWWGDFSFCIVLV